MKKLLIINADDVGFSDAINEAAKKCYLDGKISGVSVMACGARFKEAAGLLKEIGKKEAGVHLTLTGKLFPCTEDRTDVATLLNREGRFVASYKDLALKYFLKQINFEQVYLELSSQIKKVLDEGLIVTHLDSHENIHMFPKILELTIKLAGEFDAPYVRLPLEMPAVMSKSFSVKDFVRYTSLAVFTGRGKKRITRAHLEYNDAFLGHFHAGRMDYDIFCFMLDNLQEGVSELAVHPSVSSESFYREFPWYRNTEKEFEFLMNEDWKKRLDASGIRLISHSEACKAKQRSKG